ncbi:MAG TPA: PLP-dependent transferase [Holophaga sp.]|nr:PLP-dependent transferase [Holophaga sp.]
MKLDTRLIHAGQVPDPATGAVNVLINTSTTFKQDGVGGLRSGFEYSRSGNPSRLSLEATLAAIENGSHARAFASGLAAETALLSRLSPGDKVVASTNVYGGTYRLLVKVFARFGVQIVLVDGHRTEDLLEALAPDTRLVWLETPSNPLLDIVDIARIAERKPRGALLVVDNTFASPYFQTPLDLGADLVVHSTTKYLGGHSDVVGGAVVSRDPLLDEEIGFYQNAEGAVPSPFDCYLVQRGIKTLGVRMERHEANAFAVAEFLEGHPDVERVFFPGLPNHPGHAIAVRQMRGQSGIVSFLLRGEPSRFFERLRLFTLGESLGGVESLVCLPYEMTHGSVPADVKARIGVAPNLVRLSVGLEDRDELLEDLGSALS